MSTQWHTPVVGFAAWSGTGKTTLLTKLLPLLKERGLRVGVVKHAHHDFDIDHAGKDSFALRKAGAEQMLIGSRVRWALIVETPDLGREPRLWEMMEHLLPHQLDVILVEGFKAEAIPKIELHRPILGRPLLCLTDSSVIALATDAPLNQPVNLPLLDLNDVAGIAAFILERFLSRPAEAPKSLS